MPKKKDVNNQPTPSAQEIKDAVNAGYFAKTNDLDRFLYVVNVGDFANQANLLVNAQRDPQIEDDDFNPITDPEAIAKAREEQCDSHFTVEELERLEVTEDPQVPQTLSDHSEQKAEYLTLSGSDELGWRSKAIMDVTDRVRGKLVEKCAEQRQSTVFRDADSLKKPSSRTSSS